ncbi:uncharacterized protein VTP21DRAFT_3046 [Calcarisporiella thermophila]|uniref:uncharacterized protein n=1 Tax=Calcarisporiella thermophila TaxID=911321 RepID=UPI00374247EF
MAGEYNDWKGQVKSLSSKAEDLLETVGTPLKPYMPAIGRMLIVATFFEDALRIVSQWKDQLSYLERHRHFPWGLSHSFLILNVLTMLSCSVLVIAKKHSEIAVGGLIGVVIMQAIGYGLLFDISFLLRNISVMGGLLMVLSDSLSRRRRMFAALPSLSETDRRKYFQLAGRVLLIFLFLGFVLHGEWSLLRVAFSIISLAACVMVVIGFKAKWSATFLVLFLSIFNLIVNNWWSMHHAHPERDFLKYDFFQTLSIVGGLLLLVNMGPGGISYDSLKKEY